VHHGTCYRLCTGFLPAGQSLVQFFHEARFPPGGIVRMDDTLGHSFVQGVDGNSHSFPGGLKLSGGDKPSRPDNIAPALGADRPVALAPLFTHAHMSLG